MDAPWLSSSDQEKRRQFFEATQKQMAEINALSPEQRAQRRARAEFEIKNAHPVPQAGNPNVFGNVDWAKQTPYTTAAGPSEYGNLGGYDIPGAGFPRLTEKNRALYEQVGQIPGVPGLAEAAGGAKVIKSALPSEVQEAYLLGQGAVERTQPLSSAMLQGGQNIVSQLGAAMPGIAEFYRQRGGMLSAQEQAALQQLVGGRTQEQQLLAQLQALQGAPGVAQAGRAAGMAEQLLGQGFTGQLSPEMQALVAQERQLGIQRAAQAAQTGEEQRLAQLQALMAGRGLGSSTIAGRGATNVMQQTAQMAEQGRLAAEEQALQREMALRQMGEQARQASIQGALGLTSSALQPVQFQAGLTQAGLGGVQAGMGREQELLGLLGSQISQYNPQQLAAAQLGLGTAGLDIMNQLRQQEIANQLRGLEIAMGAPVTPSGGGFGQILGSTLGSVIGAGGQIGAAFAGRK